MADASRHGMGRSSVISVSAVAKWMSMTMPNVNDVKSRPEAGLGEVVSEDLEIGDFEFAK